MAVTGDRMRDKKILMIPQSFKAAVPTEKATAPIMPPMRAWDELEGMPNHQVMQVPDDGADEAGDDDQLVDHGRRRDDVAADGLGDARGNHGADEV